MSEQGHTPDEIMDMTDAFPRAVSVPDAPTVGVRNAVADRIAQVDARAFLQRHRIVVGPEDRRSVEDIASAIAEKRGLPLVIVEDASSTEPQVREL